MPNSLTLKWGTLKAWDFESEEFTPLITRYSELGTSDGAMSQRDNSEQKEIICQMIDLADEPIYSDWSGEGMTRDKAKEYVREYGQ